MGVSANRSSRVEESLRGVTIRLSRPRGERGARARATQRAKRPEEIPASPSMRRVCVACAPPRVDVRRTRSDTRRSVTRVPIRAEV